MRRMPILPSETPPVSTGLYLHRVKIGSSIGACVLEFTLPDAEARESYLDLMYGKIGYKTLAPAIEMSEPIPDMSVDEYNTIGFVISADEDEVQFEYLQNLVESFAFATETYSPWIIANVEVVPLQ